MNTNETINEVSKNLNPIDFWACLGWQTVADNEKWYSTYKDHYFYLLVTKTHETPVKAKFDDDCGGQFTILGRTCSTIGWWESDEILYVAEIPSKDELCGAIDGICEQVRKETEKWKKPLSEILQESQ